MTTQNLLVELFVEELPPKVLKKLGDAFANQLADQLRGQGLASAGSVVTPFASPRRLGAHITQVWRKAADKAVQQKLMPVSVGLDASGQATPALLKKLQALGADLTDPAAVVAALRKAPDGKADALFYDSLANGATLDTGLQKALEEALAKLPIPKVMSYQLETDCELPGWSSVHFVRPAHGLLALHGSTVVPVKVLGLTAGNSTQGHRFEARVSPVLIAHADHYVATLEQDGAVIAGFEERRFSIVTQLAQAAEKLGPSYQVLMDDELLNEVTALVERPNVLVCEFESQFLDVPQECLILTMKANQKYFPLLDAAARLTNKFLVVSNISPTDASAVIGGNERVVRPRLADAKFFFDQDRKKTLESRVEGLSKVVYHNKLGTQGERAERVRAIARSIVSLLEEAKERDRHGLRPRDDEHAHAVAATSTTVTAGNSTTVIAGNSTTVIAGNSTTVIASEARQSIAYAADTVARLAKTDLLTDMVGEFPELQGIMGGYYARHDGLSEDIAVAIEDHYKPRFAGDELPRNQVGVVVALADKLETLVGLFGIGNLPTGDKDPFALRRHALGVIRMLVEKALPLALTALIDAAWQVMKRIKTKDGAHSRATSGVSASPSVSFDLIAETPTVLSNFIYERLAGSLREQGYSPQEVDAVVSQRPQRLGDVVKRLDAVRAFTALPEAAALAAANKRISNILKKELDVDAHVSEVLLREPAEIALCAAMKEVAPKANGQFEAGDYTASLQTLAALRAPVDAFFDDVMVNAEEIDLRLNRQGLLKSLHDAMNRVADLSRLAA